MNNSDNVEINDYHLYLQNLENLDDMVTKIRLHYSNEGKTSFWLIKPFWKALISTPFRLGDTSTWVEKFLYFVVNPFVIYTIGTIDILIPFVELFEPLKEKLPSYTLLTIALMLYGLSVVKGFFKQVDIFDSTFDLNAFKAFFPVLYENLRAFKNTEPFSFSSLNTHVATLSSGNYLAMTNALEQMSTLTKTNEHLTERLADAAYLLNNMSSELKLSKKLFDKSITAFQAASSGNVSKDVLHIFSDFSLFKRIDDKLITVAKYHAYNTPDEININEPKTRDWAVVKVALAVEPQGYIEVDQSNERVVIANKLLINGDTYVYTYHLPSREFDELAHMVTDQDSQTLLYNLVLLYNQEKGGC